MRTYQILVTHKNEIKEKQRAVEKPNPQKGKTHKTEKKKIREKPKSYRINNIKPLISRSLKWSTQTDCFSHFLCKTLIFDPNT